MSEYPIRPKGEEINKESCEEFALKAFEYYQKDCPGIIDNLAIKYLNFEPLIIEMGGWANYRHHICNRFGDKYIDKLQAENKRLRDCVDELNQKVTGREYGLDSEEIWEITQKHLAELMDKQ